MNYRYCLSSTKKLKILSGILGKMNLFTNNIAKATRPMSNESEHGGDIASLVFIKRYLFYFIFI